MLTSHYMRIEVKDAFENVFNALSESFGNVYAKKYGKPSEPFFGIILDEKFFFRVESDAAVLIIVKEISSTETLVEIISCAGGHGLLGISYSAHSDYVHDVRSFLKKSGFKIVREEEIDYFDRKKCGLIGEIR